jgi:hypothetical protein
MKLTTQLAILEEQMPCQKRMLLPQSRKRRLDLSVVQELEVGRIGISCGELNERKVREMMTSSKFAPVTAMRMAGTAPTRVYQICYIAVTAIRATNRTFASFCKEASDESPGDSPPVPCFRWSSQVLSVAPVLPPAPSHRAVSKVLSQRIRL